VYLSKVIEKITAINFDDYVKQKVFDPLKMNSSSLVWLDSYKQRLAWRHDWLGKKSLRWEGSGYNAAASLRTTADDYAKFVIAILYGKGLKKATWNEMLSPQIKVNEKTAPAVSWGLGLGMETIANGKTFWHWGDQGDSKCYMTAIVAPKDAFLYFTNSSNGLSIADTLLGEAIGGEHPALAWLDYGRYNPSAKMFLQSVLDKGATIALKDYLIQREKDNSQRLDEGTINRIGYYLLRLKKVDDAIEVFNQNTIDFPESSNTWDSLAEAYMTKGNKELAIKYYEKSLELDPGNINAVEQLKKLKS
jgi:CubicO group peptidase (beta-lactamase class C family)